MRAANSASCPHLRRIPGGPSTRHRAARHPHAPIPPPFSPRTRPSGATTTKGKVETAPGADSSTAPAAA
ncbi:hypothetical protein E2562_000281 [Oryza meyeriana var. granulata]|uniref:Uncharacterized protein n=1 Tax=Oryza meyeriana var. granulata TaxID=110450 RepID=A0A6G1CMQ2_9ORYZ|nr:hypothetical protein E2562_000281 [Oryza meyeriana var. granulata]